MHDPVQDRLMIARMAYFRVKFLQLPRPYLEFIDNCLAPGGTVIAVDCTLEWPLTTVAERYAFQFGAPGGATEREFTGGGPRVREFLRSHGSSRDRWLPPATDGRGPEAEWGFAQPLAGDIEAAATERGLTVDWLQFGQPEDLSPLVAELFRDLYAGHRLPAGSLLVTSFLLMDPKLAISRGLVPYWALFGTRPSLDRLASYLSGTQAYDEMRLTVFPHGEESIGLPGIGEWQAVLRNARQQGHLIAIEPDHYPRHFRALSGFHRELSRLPRIPGLPALGWDTARQYLSTHAPARNVRFGRSHAGRER
jgi:hypothetical protein